MIDSDPTELLKVSLYSSSPVASALERGGSINFKPSSLREGDLKRAPTQSPFGNQPERGNTAAHIAIPPHPPSSRSTLPDASASNEQSLVPSQQVKRTLPAEGLYPPVNQGKNASLLWGEHLGFSRRVSRGILSLPYRILVSQPVTDAGHNGRAMCLAHGVLARNKGLAPKEFVLKLNVTHFEESSAQWPRPSKVLRSYYRKEMEDSYGGLGKAFVETAAELALLFADSSADIIKDWFEQLMEQQDLGLARRAYELGATDEELGRLYRLSYAAMLVSLACHAHGRKIRPEITVFREYYALDPELGPVPDWVSSEEMQRRADEEKANAPSISNFKLLVTAVLQETPPPEEKQA